MRVTRPTAFHLLKMTKDLTQRQEDILKAVYGKRKQEVPDKKEGIDLEVFEEFFGLPLTAAANNITARYIHAEPTRRFIMETYPEKALSDARRKTLKLPGFLEELLTDDDKFTVYEMWEKRYSDRLVKRGILIERR